MLILSGLPFVSCVVITVKTRAMVDLSLSGENGTPYALHGELTSTWVTVMGQCRLNTIQTLN